MDRIKGAGHVNNRFVTEDPATRRPPTEITDTWLNGVQEEIVSVIEEQGMVPSNADLKQLATAIKKLLQKSSPILAVASGTADAITATYTPAISGLTNGMTLYVRAALANATATPTFTPANGTIAAKAIVKGAGAALAAGDIAGGGHWVDLQYDSTLDKWVLLNPATGVTTVTATNDATFSDNGVKPASTGWVRGAMAAISTAAGFACSFTTNGYIKFPSWFGGWIVQWGSVVTSASGDVWFSFPIGFPNSVMQVYATPVLTTGGGYSGWNGANSGGVAINGWNTSNARVALTVAVLAIGK